MQSAKEKLNNLLGITEDQTIDDFLDDLDVDTNQVVTHPVDDIDGL